MTGPALVLPVLAALARGEPPAARSSECASPGAAAVADSVAAAYERHQFVFLGSTHGGTKRHDFLLCLLSRPALQQRVTDVLVEWGNPVHQRLVDRYTLRQEEVPEDSLRQVWFDTDAPELWARLPLIPAFYSAVRTLNASLPAAGRIRVLGGCEPIDWATARGPADIAQYPFKTNWAAHVIVEHYAPTPERKLLVVYGDGHIHHNGGTLMSDVAARLDRGRLYVVGTITQSDPGESAAIARLGDPARPFFASSGRLPASGPYPGALFYAREGALARYVDAVVYAGPEPDRSLAGAIEFSAAQRAELARREAIRGDRRQLMRLRFGRREEWFRSHPNELPG